MLHEAQGFPPLETASSCEADESSFEKTIHVVPISDIPAHANVISCHTAYKVKIEENSSLCFKARIATNGNEDSVKVEMRSDCSMCSPVWMRIILSTAALRRWRLTKLKGKELFRHTDQNERDVYVRTPRESVDKGRCVWLLLTAAMGSSLPRQSGRCLKIRYSPTWVPPSPCLTEAFCPDAERRDGGNHT